MFEYVLNVAVDGEHYAKIIIKADDEQEAKTKAYRLTEAFWGDVALVHKARERVFCSLTRWNKVGTPVPF